MLILYDESHHINPEKIDETIENQSRKFLCTNEKPYFFKKDVSHFSGHLKFNRKLKRKDI